MQNLWIFLHLFGVVVWVGGLFFVLHCLRPALADLQPALRPQLMVGVFERFFRYVAAAIALIWLSGAGLAARLGAHALQSGVLAMIVLAAVMTAVFVWIRLAQFPRIKQALAVSDLPGAAALLDKLRRLALLNMVLGVLAIAAVTLWR